MNLIGGLLGGSLLGAPVWYVLAVSTANLSDATRLPLQVGVTGIAVLVGVLVGSAIVRRMRFNPRGLAAFSGLALAVGTGTVCSCLVGGLTAAYLAGYAIWPAGLLDRILFVLAIPAFAGLAWFLGAGIGLVAGLLGGTLLRGLALLRR